MSKKSKEVDDGSSLFEDQGTEPSVVGPDEVKPKTRRPKSQAQKSRLVVYNRPDCDEEDCEDDEAMRRVYEADDRMMERDRAVDELAAKLWEDDDDD